MFLGLTVTFAIVFAFWLIRTNSSGQSKARTEVDDLPDLPISENDTFVNTCPRFELIGDGYCDDEANTEECMYDLNDCCEMESDRTLCQNCTCFLSDVKLKNILKEAEEGCNIDSLYDFYLIGNEECNLHLNQAKYYFDAGDCCLDETKCFLQSDWKYSILPISCPEENPCIRSNNFCILENLGDGICQDYNNGPFCDYDMGDCCVMNQNSTECCSCKCHSYFIIQ